MKLLFVDDDREFARVAARALVRRGFAVSVATNIPDALALADASTRFAVVDLRIGEDSGLPLLRRLRAINPNMRILMLSGYANIATAVDAIKMGADNYLAKPVDTDSIVAALHRDVASAEPQPISKPLPLKHLESDHIKQVLAECDGNISATARTLQMHRRTLQRKLARFATY